MAKRATDGQRISLAWSGGTDWAIAQSIRAEKEVIQLNIQFAIVIIGAGTLMVAFTALVLKIIEVARSK